MRIGSLFGKMAVLASIYDKAQRAGNGVWGVGCGGRELKMRLGKLNGTQTDTAHFPQNSKFILPCPPSHRVTASPCLPSSHPIWNDEMKIVSLLPSATEIVDILGCTDRLVGRSHECDYPPQVQQLPVCTQPKFDPVGTSGEIHDRVTEVLQSALSVYRVETQMLQQLQPTHIITQAQCEVCAVSLADVERAVAQLTGFEPEIISLQPTVLEEVWQDIRRVANCLGVDGEKAVASLQSRVAACQQQVETVPESDRPRVATIEWADPLMAAGNWVPELIELAGGQSLFGEVGKHSPWMKWEELHAADPDIIILMPCGFDLSRTRQDADALAQHPQWQELRAVRTGRVYLSDGNQYFNRPGPRLVDSLEILAEILYPDLARFGHQGQGWMPYE